MYTKNSHLVSNQLRNSSLQWPFIPMGMIIYHGHLVCLPSSHNLVGSVLPDMKCIAFFQNISTGHTPIGIRGGVAFLQTNQRFQIR